LVTFAFLMLLAPAVEVAGVDHCQRQCAALLFTEAFRKQLVIPEAGRLKFFAPGRQQPYIHAVLRLEGVTHTDVIEHRILADLRGSEPLVHVSGTLQQRDDVNAEARRGQQPDGAEYAEATADTVGYRKA